MYEFGTFVDPVPYEDIFIVIFVSDYGVRISIYVCTCGHVCNNFVVYMYSMYLYVYNNVGGCNMPTAQVEVDWMMPVGPSRYTSCEIHDAVVPPPFPIDDVTIIERNIQAVSLNSDGRTQDIEVSVRLAALLECL